MSVSPFPPGPGRVEESPSAITPSAKTMAGTASYESYPVSSAAAAAAPMHSSQPEPFSSAAAYRSSMSPPPRTTSSSFSPRPAPAVSNDAIAAAGYERATPLKSPPPASTLVIQEPAAPSSAPVSAAAAAQRNQHAGDARSARIKRDGTASISKSAHSSATSWLYGSPDTFFRVPSRNALAYILVSTVEAIVVITLVAFIFVRIASRVEHFTQDLKTVSVYLAVFVFGCVFQVLIAWDAVRLKNTMQLIGVLIFNLALTATAAIEIRQARDALNAQDRQGSGFPCPNNPYETCRAKSLFPSVERFLIAVTAVCFVVEFLLAYLTYKLWKEFGWVIYQKIGADLRVRRMFFWYQLFIVFLKFSFFFGVGFTVIYLILVASTTDWEYGVTIAAVPIAVVALFAAGFAVRREWTSLMVVSLILMVAGMAYFVFKVTQVWLPSTRDQYTYVHTTITFISGFSLASLALSLINGVICLLNFHKGLKPAHDAIGTFGGVHRQRKSRSGVGAVGGAEEGGGGVVVLDDDEGANGVEGEKYGNGHPNGATTGMYDSRRPSGVGPMQSPVYSTPQGEIFQDRRRTSGVAQPFGMHSPTATPANVASMYAPQPTIPAGSPTQHQQHPFYPHHHPPQQQTANEAAFLDAHQPRPSASRISLD